MKALKLVLVALAATGCATSGPWEGASIGCLEYANAAVHAAAENGNHAGVITCTPRGAVARHAVTWIIKDGETLYWDAAFGRYRTRRELGRIHSVTSGPSRGSFDLFSPTCTCKEDVRRTLEEDQAQ